MSDTDPIPDPSFEAVTVEPDDVLIVVLPMYTSQETIETCADDIRERIPALTGRLLVIANVEQLAVIKGGAPTNIRMTPDPNNPPGGKRVSWVPSIEPTQVGYLVLGDHCDRCGDVNYEPDTRVCLTCTYPDDPSSRAYLDQGAPSVQAVCDCPSSWPLCPHAGRR